MLKTPISYYGGKQTMLRHILPLIPEHTTYTEAFAGGAAVYWAKEPSTVEVINDINGLLVNFYRQLKSNYPALKSRIDQTLHSREEHEFAQIIYHYSRYFEKVDRAWAVWVLSKQSFASRLDGSFGYDKAKNTVAKKISNAREAFTQQLSDRLSQTQIECTDALRIIKSRDTAATFHFVDSPYIGTDMGHYGGYTEDQFKQLLSLLAKIEGKFMLTMFPHPILEKWITKHKWQVKTVIRAISASKVKRRKQEEWIVFNYRLNGG